MDPVSVDRDLATKDALFRRRTAPGLGTGHLLFRLGTHPDQWGLLRRDPALIPRAIDEALHLEMQSLLRAMVARVERIEVSAPEIALNNVLYGHRRFRASFR